jgi:phosphoenolpyruvate-protein kinase (PTS system EI component)
VREHVHFEITLGSPESVARLHELFRAGAEGVGLMRKEFLIEGEIREQVNQEGAALDIIK